jgi:hypothetical protein
VAEGVSFTQTLQGEDIEIAAWRPVKLTPQGAPSTPYGRDLFLGGNVMYVHDGRACYESGWVEGQPTVFVTSMSAGGGLTANASYTFQAVWVYIDAQGRTVRSVAAFPVTTSTTATNKVANLEITAPQVTTKGTEYLNGSTVSVGSWFVEVYVTPANPGGNSPLYLAARIPHYGSTGSVTLSIASETDQTAQELYTVGNVLDDERAPGDRGVVVVADRLWSASENKLFASHVPKVNVAPAWNQEDLFLDVPPALGSVTALSVVDATLVVICTGGTAVVSGPGLDDLGNGDGWSSPQKVFAVGGAPSPRSAASVPGGVAWVGPDGLLYVLDRSLHATAAGAPEWAYPDTGSPDVAYVPPGTGRGFDTVSGPLIAFGSSGQPIKVLDLNTGEWCRWTPASSAFSLAGAASGLWAAVTGSPYVVSFTGSGGTDLGTSFTQSVTMQAVAPSGDGSRSSWGRVRSVNPVFDTLAAHTASVLVTADEARAVVCNKSFSVPGTEVPGNWPWSRNPEFRLTNQRCSFLLITLSATPAAAAWTGLDLWAFPSGDRAPSRNRS